MPPPPPVLAQSVVVHSPASTAFVPVKTVVVPTPVHQSITITTLPIVQTMIQSSPVQTVALPTASIAKPITSTVQTVALPTTQYGAASLPVPVTVPYTKYH